MRILFCTDGSEISYNALKNFSRWVVNEDLTVDIICVIDWSYLPDSIVIEDSGFVSSCRNIADDILNYSENILSTLKVKVGEKIKLCGAAVESIVDTTIKNKYDMVLMGSNGKKGLQKWLGSVSKSVLDQVKIPVYVSKVSNNAKRILFATDGCDDFSSAVNYAIKYLSLKDKEIFLCTVNENPELLFLNGKLDSNWREAINRRQDIISKKALDKLKCQFFKSDINVSSAQVLAGIPVQSIIKYSKKINIDLIVTSTHLNERRRHFLIDNVSDKVVENALSDVLVIKL